MPPLRLSVCIPTYNFGRFIGEALSSIARQHIPGLEVIVVDGASTDNTDQVVSGFERLIPGLRYCRLESKGGIDADMAKTVELATSPYCWLFSADDVMEDGSLDRVVGHLRSGSDIYVCGLTLCTTSMEPIRRHRVIRGTADEEFRLEDDNDRHEYFRRAETSTAFFSYMSSLVINRRRWEEAGVPGEFMGSCWAHVARIFGMLPRGLSVKYLPDSYVRNRGGNDSFLDRGVVHRIGIAVDGYWKLADRYFGEGSFEARQIRRVVGNEYTLRHLLSAKWHARLRRDAGDEQRLNHLVAKLLQDTTLRNTAVHLAYRVTPLRISRGLYRAAKRVVGIR